MTKLTCIIIEDERPAQEVLKSYIVKSGLLELKGVFDDAISAMEFLKTSEIDVAFLDIQMPSLSGMDFIKIIKNQPQIIITTAYSEYAVEAFELNVYDYLKKPFSFERFMKAVNKLSVKPNPDQVHQLNTKISESDSFAFFNVNKTMVKVLFDEILYIESMREYIVLHTTKGKVATKIGTSEIEKMLAPNFLRIHRSFIINTDKITAFNAEDVFINNTQVPIGISYKKQIESTFKKHLF